ncbi:MAG: ABC transporter substrate-binding protein [Thermodesulfobacteriota bacterium]|jgi:ABC-type branched-subunit amino acid transport system substrate-binding protein
MRKKSIFKAVGLLIFFFGLSFIVVPAPVIAAEAIPMGILLPYTGPLGWVAACQTGADIARDEINAAGGVLGRQIQFFIADDEGKSDAAIAGEEKLININKVPAIIGPTSVTFRSVMPIAIKNKVVQISPTAGTTALDFVKEKYVFRTVSSDVVMGSGMVFEAVKRGYKKAALFFGDDESSQSIRGVIVPACKAAGIEIVGDVIFTQQQTSYRSELLSALKNKPPVVFFEADPQSGAVIFKQVTELKLGGDWIGTDFVSDQFLKATWPYSKGVGAVQPAAKSSPRNDVFTKEVEKRRGKQGVPVFTVNAYDAMIIMALAMESAKKADGESIAENIRKVANPPGTKVYSYAEGVKLLREGKKIDYEGLAGPQNFDEYGNVVTSLGIFKIEDNQRKVLGFLDENDFGDLLKKVRDLYQKK